MTFLALVALASANCLNSCRFHFCDSYDVMPLYNRTDQIDRAITPAICHKRMRVGIANSGEALVRMRDGYTRIGKIPLNGGRARIAPHFFKTFTIRRTRYSGVGHQTLQFEEDAALGGRCVALPITHVQKLADGNVQDNIVLSGRPMRDCVSFRVRRMGRHGAMHHEESEPEMSEEPMATEEPLDME